MQGFRRREVYWDDAEARAAFQVFLKDIHHLDLGAWEAAGYWDDNYRPFSLFDDDGQVVSSVCVYSLDLVVEGAPVRAAQISGVGTLPAFRRRGLNRDLTEVAIDWARDTHDFFFLFSDEEAVPFYARCGFQPVEEYTPHLAVSGRPAESTPRKLDMDHPEDFALLQRAARTRGPVSERLGVLSEDLLVFHALYPLRDTLHYVEPLDAVVAFQRHEHRLSIHDVVAKKTPTWRELAPHLVTPETTDVAFSFCPDLLGVQDIQWRLFPENDLHDRGDLPLRGQTFLFPYTAHA